jgi:hypothetical protein
VLSEDGPRTEIRSRRASGFVQQAVEADGPAAGAIVVPSRGRFARRVRSLTARRWPDLTTMTVALAYALVLVAVQPSAPLNERLPCSLACRIDIEDAETGRCLTDWGPRNPSDVFHSRLQQSPGRTWLASAGWVWHPFDVACLWNLKAVLQDPTVLDRSQVVLTTDEEVTRIGCGAERLQTVLLGVPSGVRP